MRAGISYTMSSIGQPLVSVIIPAWNAEKWIAESLSSVIAQTWSNLEIIVVDDGSTDHTAIIISDNFPSVRYIYQNHAGLPTARNRGVAESDGDFLAFLDSDDLWLPGKIEAQMLILLSEPKISLVFCDYEPFGLKSETTAGFDRGPILKTLPTKEIEKNGKIIVARDTLTPLLKDQFCQIPSCWLVKREDFDRINGFDITLRTGAEDWLFAIQLANIGLFAFDTRKLARRREHTGSHSRNNNLFISFAKAIKRLIAEEKIFPKEFITAAKRQFAYSCLYIGQTVEAPAKTKIHWLILATRYASSLSIKDILYIYSRAVFGIIAAKLIPSFLN